MKKWGKVILIFAEESVIRGNDEQNSVKTFLYKNKQTNKKQRWENYCVGTYPRKQMEVEVLHQENQTHV